MLKLVAPFDEGSKNTALSEFVAERPNFCHSQITQKILDFKDVYHQCGRIKTGDCCIKFITGLSFRL